MDVAPLDPAPARLAPPVITAEQRAASKAKKYLKKLGVNLPDTPLGQLSSNQAKTFSADILENLVELDKKEQTKAISEMPDLVKAVVGLRLTSLNFEFEPKFPENLFKKGEAVVTWLKENALTKKGLIIGIVTVGVVVGVGVAGISFASGLPITEIGKIAYSPIQFGVNIYQSDGFRALIAIFAVPVFTVWVTRNIF